MSQYTNSPVGVASVQEAKKDNKKDCKPPIKYIHPDFIEGPAYGMLAGEMKYGAWNYLNGHNYTDLLDAAIRHLNAVRRGEDIDENCTKILREGYIRDGQHIEGFGEKAPKVHHLWLAACNINMILSQMAKGTLKDDREF